MSRRTHRFDHRLLATMTALAVLMVSCADDATTAPAQSTSLTSTSPPAADEVTSTPPTTTAEPETVGAPPTDVNFETLQEFLAVAPEDDGPFYMVNLIRYRDLAVYPDGRDTDLTGREADEIYVQYMSETQLPTTGAESVFLADVGRDLTGGTSFDVVAIVRYPSRAEFITMSTTPGFQDMLIHKEAGVADTITMAAQLIDDAPSASGDDLTFALVELYDIRDAAAVEQHDSQARHLADAVGGQLLARFEVLATIIGPAGRWDEVRITRFPDPEAHAELSADPEWADAGAQLAAGLNEVYTLETFPFTNTLG